MANWIPDFSAAIADNMADSFGPLDDSDEEVTCSSCGSTVFGRVCGYCGEVSGSTEIEEDAPEVVRKPRPSGSSQRSVESFLHACNETHKKDNPMPMVVLDAVAKRYMEISETLNRGFGADGAKKEVVRRGNRRKEVIAALLHFELIRAGFAKKRESVAAFLDLRTMGFSRGESIVRKLHSLGVYKLPSDDGIPAAYMRKYFAALGIVDENSAGFVLALVEATDRRFACASSCIASKIVGAIWITMRKQGCKITTKDIEKVDSIKKSTFMKYSKYVDNNIEKYRAIFEAYGIPTEGSID